MVLKRGFYRRDPITVAKALLGKTLVHETLEGTTSGIIVETEAYLGPEDKASHAFGNLRTKRTEIQFGPKGHAYVYLIYGLHCCFNVISGAVSGKPEAVFIRALRPLEGIELMTKRRPAAGGKLTALTNGPGRLCVALNITKKLNGVDLTVPPFFIRDDCVEVNQNGIVQTPRIGVDYADEWKNMPWRFYVKDSPYVSRKNK